MSPGRVPPLVLIADGFTQPGLDRRIVQCARYGVPWIMLRDHGAREDILSVSASVLVRRIRKVNPEVVLSLNGPSSLATTLQVGRHLPAHAESVNGNSDRLLVGRSTHSEEDVLKAGDEGMDYVLYGHVFETASHRGEVPRGILGLERAVAAADKMPVIAVGGITPERVGSCLDAGAQGVAILSGLMQAPNLFQAVDAYTRAFTSRNKWDDSGQ